MRPLDLSTPPGRILIIKPSAVGDVVHGLPVLNLLRRKWPQAHISWLVTPVCSGILEGHPQLDEVILFDRKRLSSAWKSSASRRELFSLGRRLRAGNFDLVIDLQGLFRSGWMAWKTRAPIRIGFSNARELAPIFYTHKVDVGTTEQHAIDRYLSITEALGCGRGPVEFIFPTDDADRAAVRGMLPEPTRYAVLLPGTNWLTKRWPVESFAALVDPLRERFGLETVVAGAAGDKALAAKIGGIDLTGRTSLRQLAALLEGADLVIANDSGPMHIAAALGRPLVAIFGPTNPVRTGPYHRLDTVVRMDIICSPCYSRYCSHRSCLRWLGIVEVLAAAERQLRGARSLPVLR
jgi:lipopolysaccharide heptosyltransferase I